MSNITSLFGKTDEEIDALKQKLAESKKFVEELNFAFAKHVIAQSFLAYDINEISIDPHYEYNDEGFCGTYMIYIDGEDACYEEDKNVSLLGDAEKLTLSELQERIDNELSDLNLTEEITINMNQLRAEYNFTPSLKQTTNKKINVSSGKFKQ